MQIDSQLLLFGALILLVSFLINLIVVLIVRRNIKNDRMSKMITMQQAAFRSESASTLDRMRTTAKECQQNVELSISQAGDMVNQISDSLKTLSDYQEDLAALQAVCAEYKMALEKLRISTDQAEARITAVQQEVQKVETVNERMDAFRAEAERCMNQLQDLKAEYVRLVAATQESLKTAAENQKNDNQDMLASFVQQIERAKEQFSSFVTQERMDFKAFSDAEMKKADDATVDAENRRDSILKSLEEGKAELESFRSDLSESVASMQNLRDSIKGQGDEAVSSFLAEIAKAKETANAELDEKSDALRAFADEFSASAKDNAEQVKSNLSDNADTLIGHLSEVIREQKEDFDEFVSGKKNTLENDSAAIISSFKSEKEALSSAMETFSAERSCAEENTKSTIAEALKNIENARLALDGERSSFIEASKDAISRSFSEMLEGVNQRYDRIKNDADAFVKAIADRVNDTRETITLLTQGEQQRIQDSVERLQELDRKIKGSEEQLQGLSETITSTREELFTLQQDRGRLDSEIEESLSV